MCLCVLRAKCALCPLPKSEETQSSKLISMQICLLQPGVVGPEAGEATEVHRSRVTLRTLALLDRQVKAKKAEKSEEKRSKRKRKEKRKERREKEATHSKSCPGPEC